MRLLVDANLSHRVAELLREAGHDAVHVRDVGLRHASDAEILDAAVAQDRVIVSEDTDFGALLAHRRQSRPSFVLLRSVEPLTPQQQALLLTANLPSVEKELDEAPSRYSTADGCASVRCPSTAGDVAPCRRRTLYLTGGIRRR